MSGSFDDDPLIDWGIKEFRRLMRCEPSKYGTSFAVILHDQWKADVENIRKQTGDRAMDLVTTGIRDMDGIIKVMREHGLW